jgi:hypothetical protein
MLKLVGLCLAVAMCLCGAWPLVCASSGFWERAVLLPSGNESNELFCLHRCLLHFSTLVCFRLHAICIVSFLLRLFLCCNM